MQFLNLIFTLSVYTCAVECSLRWLALDKFPVNAIWNRDDACQKTFGLTGKQVRFCRQNFKWMKSVLDAAMQTKEECQGQFEHRKWNCLSVNRAPKFDMDLKKDTKEAAFLYALSTASLALSVSRRCMAGNINECNCNVGRKHLSVSAADVNTTSDLLAIDRRVGCKGIIKIGKDFTDSFINLGFRKKPRNYRQIREVLVRRHNIDVGLKAVSGSENVACVCNGATSGCVVKYCYRRLKPVQEIADQLFSNYDNAKEVSFEPTSNTENEGNSYTAYKIRGGETNTLAYLTATPDHCSASSAAGTKVRGRLCEIDPKLPNSCDKLCCNRGFRQKEIVSVKQCDCKFVFCCEVKCTTCRSTKTVYECM